MVSGVAQGRLVMWNNQRGRHVFAATLVAWAGAMVSYTLAAEVERRVVEIDDDTPVVEVNRYYSLQAHGPTQQFFTLADTRVIVVLATRDGTAEVRASVHVFDPEASVESLEKWLNNQHSDALYADAAEPVRSVAIPAERLRCEVSKPIAHEVGRGGDEYDHVQVTYVLDDFSNEFIELTRYTGTLDAFVRTRELTRR
jgi:hypothetical protein